MTPTPKVTTAAIAGAVVVIAVWIAGLVGFTVPAEVAAAFTVLASFIAGWFKADVK